MSGVREMLLELGEAVADSLEGVLAGPIRLGRRDRYDGHLMDGRAVPVRVAHVAFTEQLADSMVIISSLPEDVLGEITESAVRGISERLDISGLGMEEPEFFEFEDIPWAKDNLEALWDEPCVHIDTGQGALLLVFGEVMVTSAERLMRRAAGLPADDVAMDEFAIDEDAAAAAAAAGPSAAAADAATPAAAGAGLDQSSVDDLVAAALAGAGSAPADDAVALPELGAGTRPAAAAEAAGSMSAEAGPAPWQALLGDVPVRVTAELGQTDLMLGRLASIADGSVVTLDEQVGDPIRVYVNGSLYAHARLVVVNGEYGIEIDEIVGSRPVAVLGGRTDD